MVWETQVVPTARRTAVLLTLFNQGYKSKCSYYSGVRLVDVKLFKSLLLKTLQAQRRQCTHFCESGFPSGRGCIDLISTAVRLSQLTVDRCGG